MGLSIPDTKDAKWRPLYEHVRSLDYGTMLTYADLDAFCEGDSKTNRWFVNATHKNLLRYDEKALLNIRGEGYKVATPEEFLTISRNHRLRGKRQTRKSWQTAEAAPLDKIKDPEVRKALRRQATEMRAMESRLAYMESRQAKAEEAIKDVSRTQKETDAEMRERIEALEAALRNSHQTA